MPKTALPLPAESFPPTSAYFQTADDRVDVYMVPLYDWERDVGADELSDDVVRPYHRGTAFADRPLRLGEFDGLRAGPYYLVAACDERLGAERVTLPLRRVDTLDVACP